MLRVETAQHSQGRTKPIQLLLRFKFIAVCVEDIFAGFKEMTMRTYLIGLTELDKTDRALGHNVRLL